MRKLMFLSVGVLGLMAAPLPFLTTAAQAQCSTWSDVKVRCQDDVKAAAKEVMTSRPSQVPSRVRETGTAVRDCINCAMEVFRSGSGSVR